MQREELALVAGLIALAAAMFAGSFAYPPAARWLPMVAAGLTIGFGAVVVFREYFHPETGDSDIAERLGEVTDREVEDVMAAPDEKVYSPPFTDRTLSYRPVIAGLLVLYLGAFWLIGLFWSTLLFLGLYVRVMAVSRRNAVILFAFTLGALMVFDLWLETPLFRPVHDWFPVPRVIP